MNEFLTVAKNLDIQELAKGIEDRDSAAVNENDTNEKKLPGISYSKNLCIILSSENRKIFSMLAAQFSMIISISSKKCVSKESMIKAVA